MQELEKLLLLLKSVTLGSYGREGLFVWFRLSTPLEIAFEVKLGQRSISLHGVQSRANSWFSEVGLPKNFVHALIYVSRRRARECWRALHRPIMEWMVSLYGLGNPSPLELSFEVELGSRSIYRNFDWRTSQIYLMR